MAILLLERGMTAAAFAGYIESDKDTAPLHNMLAPGTDGDLLLNMIQSAGRPDAAGIQPFFEAGAEIGTIGKLALKLHKFVEMEKKVAALHVKEQKKTRSDEKSNRLAAAMEMEKAASVTLPTGKLLFEAAVAASKVAADAKVVARRKHFERDGVQFTVTLPANRQPHMQYLVENLEKVLLDMAPHPPYLGAKLVNREEIFKKGKGKTKAGDAKEHETKQVLKIHVPGVTVAEYLLTREKMGMCDLLFSLRQPQGPYCQAQFMAHVSQHQAASQGEWKKMIATVQLPVMKKMQVKAMAKISAACSMQVASARKTLAERLMAKEAAKGEAAKGEAEQLIQAARAIVAAEEAKQKSQEDEVENKWDAAIVKRKEVEAKERIRQEKMAEETAQATKRKADQQEAAQVAVQREAVAKAHKRGHRQEAWVDVAKKQGEVTVDTLKNAADGACFAVLDRNDAADETWRRVFLVRSTFEPAHFKLLDEKRELLDESDEGCAKGVISDEDADHSVFVEWGMYYKSPPPDAPTAAPAAPMGIEPGIEPMAAAPVAAAPVAAAPVAAPAVATTARMALTAFADAL